MKLSDCNLIRYSPDIVSKPFCCSIFDLNDFLQDDALHYLEALMAVTYLLEFGDETAAYFCLSNDFLAFKESVVSSNGWRRILSVIPHEKRHLKGFPAAKIGRFAVNAKYAGGGLGTEILDYIKISFTTKNKTGCRFIIVDAINNGKATNFYLKNGFVFMGEKDKDEKTRIMLFDLKLVKPGGE